MVEVSIINKRDSFPFSTVRTPYKPSKTASNIVYFVIDTVSLRTARPSNNPDSISTAIRPLATCIKMQGVSIKK